MELWIYLCVKGDVTKRELGFAAIPGKEEDFKKSIEMTIDYAKALNCPKFVFKICENYLTCQFILFILLVFFFLEFT